MPAPESIELLVIHHCPSRKSPGCGWKLRLIQYFGEGGSTVKLEKVSYFQAEGKMREARRHGLGLSDLDILRPRWKEIVAVMKDPPAAPKKEPKKEEHKEVPF